MALQGDLSSFALPDVLRLLAGSGKTGALEVSTSTGSGEIWFHAGGIVGGAVSSAGHAVAPADVVFELLRHEGGSFAFDDEEAIEEAPASDVESVLAEAEGLVAEWVEVEEVVPSMDSWVTLAPEVDEDVQVTVDGWRAIAAVGSGGNVRDLADALAVTDLAASRAVKELVEQGLAEVRASHAYAEAAPVDELPSYLHDAAGAPADAGYDPDARYAHHDAEENLAVLRTEERAVVMEERDDAHLPEPLPGEGYAYGDDVEDLGVGSVDGPSFDHGHAVHQPEALPPHEPAGYEPGPYESASYEAASYEPQGFEPTFVGEGGHAGYGDTFPDEAAPRVEFLEDFAASMTAPPAPPAPAEEPVAEPPADDDRGSLLKFLSTVKP